MSKIFNIGFIFLLGFYCHSQTPDVKKDSLKTHRLNEVVVTATRTQRQLSSVPMPVQLISKKQIKRTGATRLRDVILEQTGIVMVSDFGNSEGVQLQGMDAEYTLILIDGVPLIGRTAGNIDINRISVNNIKQIEIVKGASSSLYGSEALGGVINIITEKPTRNQYQGNVKYMAKFGAKNELDLNGNVRYKKDNIGLVANVNLNSSNGFDLSPETTEKTAYPYQNFTGNLTFLYDISKKLNFSISNRYFKEEIKNSKGKGFRNDFNISTILSHKITDNFKIDYSFYATRFKTESVFNNSSSVFNQTLFRPEIKAQFPIKKGEFIGGIGANFDALNRTFFDGKEQYNSQYIFGQYDVNVLQKLNLVLGIRYDKFNKFKSAVSPKISAFYTVTDWLSVKSSVGFGYKVPDFRQLFFNFRNTNNGYIVLGMQTLHKLYGNLPEVQGLSNKLKPEISVGYNFGLQIKPINQLTLHINFFRNNIKDLIHTFSLKKGVPDLPNISVFSYENKEEVYTQGIELDAKYQLTNNFKLLAGYQFLNTADKKQLNDIKAGTVFFRRTPSSPSERLQISNYFGLPNRSKHTANVKLFYENFRHQFSANIRANFRSKYALFDTNNSSGIIDDFDDFVTSNIKVNISVEKTFFNLMNIQFGINNLFNEKGIKNKKKFKNLDQVLHLGSIFYGAVQFTF